MQTDLPQFIDRIFDGYAILFLGSGFSAHAKNRYKEPLPTGTSLARLFEKLELSSEYPLDVLAREAVLAEWQKTLFLRDESPETRGWLLDVMKCVESLGKREFTLDEVYAFERHLGDLYPGNQNVRPKIRQQLQFLRDRGFIDFVSRGNYRLRS